MAAILAYHPDKQRGTDENWCAEFTAVKAVTDSASTLI